MKHIFIILLAAVSLYYGCQTKRLEVKTYNKGLHIVPLPSHVIESEGVFELTKNTKLVIEGKDADKAANYFASKIKNSTGFELEKSGSTGEQYYKLND